LTGTGHDRFDFTIGLMIDSLAHPLGKGRRFPSR
jgi:hypothetical protein